MKHIRNIIFILSFMLSSFGVMAQADMDDGDGTVPVDGGISLLLAAGAALGGRKLFIQSRQDKD
jgi:hypothetical protein